MADAVKIFLMSAFLVAFVSFSWARNEYQIQQDTRAMQIDLMGRGNIERYLGGGELSKSATVDLYLMLNFYKAVWRQGQDLAISPSFDKAMSEDFCAFFNSRAAITRAWGEMQENGQIGPAHQAMRTDWCGQ